MGTKIGNVSSAGITTMNITDRKYIPRLQRMKKKYMPTDILLNILLRLPAASLRKMKLLSKQWLQTISAPDFKEAHLISRSAAQLGFLLSIRLYSYDFLFRKDLFIVEGGGKSSSPTRECLHLPRSIDGSCKGLILYHTYHPILYVVNPMIGDGLEDPQGRLPCLLGYNDNLISASIGCSNKKYGGGGEDQEIKVVVLYKKRRTGKIICGLLTVYGSDRISSGWRQVPLPISLYNLRRVYTYRKPVLAGGAFHWTYESGILSLDLAQEKFHHTDVTFCSFEDPTDKILLLELEGCLAVVVRQKPDSAVTVWVLRNSGWRKHGDAVDIVTSIGHSSPRALVSVRGGDLIVFCKVDTNLISFFAYDVGRRATTTLAQFDNNGYNYGIKEYSITPHVNTLISYKRTYTTTDYLTMFQTGIGHSFRDLQICCACVGDLLLMLSCCD